MSCTGLFITGTDTGVGKTLVAAALVRLAAAGGRRVVGLKPVASGATRTVDGLRNDDALALQAAGSVSLPYALVNPSCFEPAIAPHLAAAEAGAAIELPRLVDGYRVATRQADLAIVEGAGGWRVPLHPAGFLSDLPEQLGLGVILVVGLRLGCLNHARLTFEAIERTGRCRFAGWIGNAIDRDFTPEDGAINPFLHLPDAETQLAALAAIRSVVVDGGLLLLDLMAPDPHCLAGLDGRVILEFSGILPDGRRLDKWAARTHDLARQTIQTTVMFDTTDPVSGALTRVTDRYATRYIHRWELEHLLARAGWELIALYGSYDLEPYRSESERMIALATWNDGPLKPAGKDVPADG